MSQKKVFYTLIATFSLLSFLFSFPKYTNAQTCNTGDGDGNGTVDVFDYVFWLQNFNQNIQGPQNGDFDCSGYVDGLDYIIWWQNFDSVVGTPTPVSRTLQFKSGFESKTYISNNEIRGVDNSAPSGVNNWDKIMDYLPWVKRIKYGDEGGSMELAQDPINANNKVLHFHNKTAVGPRSRTQWSLKQVSEGSILFDKQFYRQRMFIDEQLQNLYGINEKARWFMIWESHVWSLENTRHAVNIGKDAGSDKWHFLVRQQRPEGNTVWESIKKEISVPIGEWFTFEVFFKYHETDGEFFVAVTRDNGLRQVAGHLKGRTKYDILLNNTTPFKFYHNSDYIARSSGGIHQYYDDFEIWSDYPPGY